MIDVGYQRIVQIPPYPIGLSASALSAYKWDSQSNDVVSFKADLKNKLRREQFGRCCYCRRFLPDQVSVHIEHILEKAVFPVFTFEIRNLALACATCNSKKNMAFARLRRVLHTRAKRRGQLPPITPRCPSLVSSGVGLVVYPAQASDYRWVHPHWDDYSANITVRRNWVFGWLTWKGRRMLRALELNALVQLERRALDERLASRRSHLSLLIGAISELNTMQARDVCDAVVAELRRRHDRADSL